MLDNDDVSREFKAMEEEYLCNEDCLFTATELSLPLLLSSKPFFVLSNLKDFNIGDCWVHKPPSEVMIGDNFEG